ncbi:hypothetical protein [Streptomyces fumanus]|uniref:hypothetical protein n=1 Tax=Streptomyces fumanus TaxID=67302 RepID=UPI00340A897A
MPDDNGSDSGNSGFGHAFSSGKARAGDAEKSAEEVRKGIPGTGDGHWDEEEESVSGDVSAYVRSIESGRDPWQPRQTAHGALDVMKGFLGPHFKNFQSAADGQRKVSEDPKSTSGMAASSVKTSAGQKVFTDSAKIREENQPQISEETEKALKDTYHQAGGAVLLAGGMGSCPDVAVDVAHDRAYVVTDDGKLYSVDLTTHIKRQVMTGGTAGARLGQLGGVASDGKGNAYITVRNLGHLLRVRLSSGHPEKIAEVGNAYGIRLDKAGEKAYVTTSNGLLYEVDVRSKDSQPKKLAEGLGNLTSAVDLDGSGKAYTGNLDETHSLREIDIEAGTSREPRPVAPSSTQRSGGLALDGAGAAYVGDHLNDVLYRVDLASGREREVVVKAGGAFSPLGVALDSVHRVVYVSTHEGQLWRFSLRVLESPELIEIRTGV